jgi:UDP-N-acetylglucosamine 1-carboxyvinyltransferase
MTLTEETTGQSLRQIGALVRDARRHHGLTRAQLAERLETSPDEIASIEQGDQDLTWRCSAGCPRRWRAS